MCWFNVFFCESSVIFDISSPGRCLGKICCTSLYHRKLPFPPRPCGWPSRWSLACLALLRVAFCCPTSLLSTSSKNMLLVLPCDQLIPPSYNGPLASCLLLHHFKFYTKFFMTLVISSSSPFVLLRNQEVDRVSSISVDSLKASWIFRSLII